MVVLRGVEDQKAFDKGMNNATTARALAVLMQKLGDRQGRQREGGRGDGRDPEATEVQRRHPRRASRAGTPVAHKTGTITKIHHDAAIVYGPRPYVLVVLVRGIQDQKVSAVLMATISREVWSAFSK